MYRSSRNRCCLIFIFALLTGCGAPPAPVSEPTEGSVLTNPANSHVDYPRVIAEELKSLEAHFGAPLDLAMNPKLQTAVEKTLLSSGHPGAALVVNAQTGAVLAIHEIPGIDPHPLTTPKEPASTIKTFVALAGIHEKTLTFDEVIKCTGDYKRLEGFTCYGEHGPLTLDQGLVTSCNIFFYEVAYRLDIDPIVAHFANFGFGKPTGIEISEETGIVPDRQWYEKHGKKAAAILGIGHGPYFVTPLQMARAYVGVATGRLPELALLHPKSETSPPSELPYGEQVLAKVRSALENAVEAENGTGRNASVSGLKIAGKTGTGSGVSPDENIEPPTIGWFAGFAPSTKPEIVVVVLIEGGGPGGETAAATAGRIFSAWMDL